MKYCYKCGKEINQSSGYCPKCGAKLESVKKKSNGTLGAILGLVAFGGIIVGLFLLIGGIIASIMNPIIENTSQGGRVWAIGMLVWMIFYSTGLIDSAFMIGIISLGVGIGAYVLCEKVD